MEYSEARQYMVDGQLRPNKVNNNNVLSRFLKVNRENFVAPAVRGVAYTDTLLPMAEGRSLLPPLTIARLVQELDVQATDTVLVTAAGSGYTAAILAGLAKSVVAVEEDQRLHNASRNNLLDNGCQNVELVQAVPEGGCAAQGPYDKIFIDVPVDEVPAALVSQLKDSGKLAAVVRGTDGLLEATLFEKHGKTLVAKPLFETKGDVLINFAQPEGFVFS